MAVTQIVDMADVLAFIFRGASATDAQIGRIQFLKPRVEAAIRQEIGSGVVQNTYTHYLPEIDPVQLREQNYYGSNLLRLPQFPVRSITSVYVDLGARFGQTSGAFPESSLLTAGDDYFLELDRSGLSRLGYLVRTSGQWPADPGSIKITYVAGWSQDELRGNVTDPDLDASLIQHATLITFAEFWSDMVSRQNTAGQSGPIKSETIADYSVTYDTEAGGGSITIPNEAKDLLRAFKRKRYA